MDTSSLPDVNDWEVIVDGTPYSIDSFSWPTSTKLVCTINQNIPSTSGIIRLKQLDVDCKDQNGNIAYWPQEAQFYP